MRMIVNFIDILEQHHFYIHELIRAENYSLGETIFVRI